MSQVRSSWIETIKLVGKRRYGFIAALAIVGILVHLALRFGTHADASPTSFGRSGWCFLSGGVPLTLELLVKLVRGEFGSDLLAGISIVTSVFLEEYLAGSLVVLMLSGGEALEAYAVRSASRALEALARRMPSTAHRRENGELVDVALESAFVSAMNWSSSRTRFARWMGRLSTGHSAMDESYLTGEPYVLSKTPGSSVLSGAVNGEGASNDSRG